MGRRLSGPRKKSNSGDNWFACLTVPKAHRRRAGKSELWRSLGTADYARALVLWGPVMEQLRRDLEALINPSLADQVQQCRQGGVTLDKDGYEVPLTASELAAVLTQDREHADAEFGLVAAALKTGDAMALTWEELIDVYAKARTRKKGEPPSKAALFELKQGTQAIKPFAAYPDLLTRSACKQLLQYFRNETTLSGKTIQSRMGMLQTLIKIGILEDAVKLETNPFQLVDFAVTATVDDSYRSFSHSEIKELFSVTDHPGLWYLLFGTGLRVGELWSRDPQKHLDGDIIVINPTVKQGKNWKPKTTNSHRRIPLDSHAMEYVETVLPFARSQNTLMRILRKEIRSLSTYDEKLVIHSTRHTYKTLQRRCGIAMGVADELFGHRASQSSRTSEGYGDYSDDLLQQEQSKVWEYLAEMLTYKHTLQTPSDSLKSQVVLTSHERSAMSAEG